MKKFNKDMVLVSAVQVDSYRLEIRSIQDRFYIGVFDLSINAYHWAGDLLLDFETSDMIKEDMIPYIDQVVNGKEDCDSLGIHIIGALVEPEYTYFMDDKIMDRGKLVSEKDPSMYMKTETFREIAVKWMEFLESKGR